MDRLLQRQKAIQNALAERHLRTGHVILRALWARLRQ
jgi:hypothetical protein